MELVHADHLTFADEEDEEFVDNARIRGYCVVRVGIIDVRVERDSIRVKLTLIAVILRGTETHERAIVSPDGKAAVAPVERG